MLGKVSMSADTVIPLIGKMATNYWIVLGVICWALSAFFWIILLSKVEVSYAYPFLALTYILVLIGSVLMLGESYALLKIVGTLLIGVGVVLVWIS